jgi:ADP-heptose:LPS heptosyltransferase
VGAAKKTVSPLAALLARHAAALGYAVRVVLPVIFRTRRRPVIFSRYTGMGDIICTIPAVRELQKRHPGATFIFNCHPDFVAVPQLAGVADRTTSTQEMGIIGHWYRFLLGGFYHFAHGDDLPGVVAQEPMVKEFLRQFELPITEEHPALAATPAVTEKVKALLAQHGLVSESLVLIHPGPSWPVKEWPPEKWAALVAELRARGFTSIAQLGVAKYLIYDKISVEPIPGLFSLVDALTLEECFAVVAQARLFIGIDSGLLHIAAATRTPAVGIFGSTQPEFLYSAAERKFFVTSRVDCVGCFHRKPRLNWLTGCPHEVQCLKSIEVAEVLAACEAQLK